MRVLWLLMSIWAGASVASTPPGLEPWRAWVMDGLEHLDCPWLGTGHSHEARQRPCAWPEPLRIEADADGARFSQHWQVFAEADLPLPGDPMAPALAVRVNGSAVVVQSGSPSGRVRVPAGRHELSGRLHWTTRPSTIRVPTEIPLIDLTLDGAVVAMPRREGEQLWLGDATSQRVGPDRLTVHVHRELIDGVPMMLRSQIRLDVGGRAREVTLGPTLPEGFVATGLEGVLPALLQTDGRLRVQLRAGSHLLHLHARASAVIDEVVVPAIDPPWPNQEIWGYQSDPRLRSSHVLGGAAIDPTQAEAPWRNLPTFLLKPGEALRIEQIRRGLDANQENRLTVARELRLAFDGASWFGHDRVSGQLRRDWRLDTAAPWQLLSARDRDHSAVVTQHDDGTGIELRRPRVQAELFMRADRGGRLPASGLDQTVERLSATLHLPPGYRLLAAPGADHAPQAWVSGFNLLDLFLIGLVGLLAGRWLGRGFGVVVAVYAVLVWFEVEAPRLSLFAVLVVGLLAAALASHRVGRGLRWAGIAMLVVTAWITLPFSADQLRYAMHPQLEPVGKEAMSPTRQWREARERRQQRSQYERSAAADRAREVAMSPPVLAAPPAPPPPPTYPADPAPQEATLDRVEVTGSRIKRTEPEMLERYAPDALPQSGPGQPDWQWHRYQLDWNGPVLAEQSLRPILLSPWATRALRALTVVLLLVILARCALAMFAVPRTRLPARWRWLALALLLPGVVSAQVMPTPELLREWRERVQRAPACVPACLHMERAQASIVDNQLRLQLRVHASTDIAVGIPYDARSLGQVRVRQAGRVLPLRWRERQSLWLPLTPGVHDIEMDAIAAGDSIELRFPSSPSLLEVDAEGWQIAGVGSNGRLQGDTLQLLREADLDAEAGAAAEDRQRFTPYVQLQRSLNLDLDWTVVNTVYRLAPDQGGFELRLPLLDGEEVLSEADPDIDADGLRIAFSANQNSRTWRSRLPARAQLELTAPPLFGHAEIWRIVASPWWHLEHEGVPAVQAGGDGDDNVWVHEFHPLPGERLIVRASRPAAVPGARVAIDRARLQTHAGLRARDHSLTMTLRATHSGLHTIGLPPDSELLDVRLNDQPLEQRIEKDRLALALVPGSHNLVLRLREHDTPSWWQGAPALNLGANAANLHWQLNLPAERWLLWTQGPRLGPSVQFWPLLALMLVLAWGLARFRHTPLRLRHWLLLAFGLATFAWWGLLLVAAWLLASDWRQNLDPQRTIVARFQLLQIGLMVLTVAAIATLVATVPHHLLGQPDMGVSGHGSSAGQLHWFADTSADGAWFSAGALSVPLWLHKIIMLTWTLWLAIAAIGWLRWSWQALGTGGHWRRRPTTTVPAAVSATADTQTPTSP